jgi:hypothetical protein
LGPAGPSRKKHIGGGGRQIYRGSFQRKVMEFERAGVVGKAGSRKTARPSDPSIDKSKLSHPEPRRIRDREHVRFVAKQSCLICGRTPTDPHHLRFAQHRSLGRKVSDEFTVPLCRGHHREVHRCGDEAAWWEKAGINPSAAARALWLKTRPLPTKPGIESMESTRAEAGARPGVGVAKAAGSLGPIDPNDETN